MRPTLPAIVAILFAACTSDPGTTLDGGSASDASAGVDAAEPFDAGRLDAAVITDAIARDADPVDARNEDAEVVDTGPMEADASTPDATAPDATSPDSGLACMPLDLEVYIVQCPSGFEYLRHWVDPNNAACPDYVTLLGQQYADVSTAIAGAGCDAQCVYQASISVSFIDHCGRRNGYIVFAAPNCPDVYEFSNGLYPSVMAWQEATPCGG